ncbi:hypothetical protein KM043_013036 [Ampulex compressa]|nr:hypothetical protein KM043_013036 [Ampulex compressa]
MCTRSSSGMKTTIGWACLIALLSSAAVKVGKAVAGGNYGRSMLSEFSTGDESIDRGGVSSSLELHSISHGDRPATVRL